MAFVLEDGIVAHQTKGRLMHVATFRSILTGEVFTGHETTDNPASSYGKPVWVNDETGEAFDMVGVELVEDDRVDVVENARAAGEAWMTEELEEHGDEWEGLNIVEFRQALTNAVTPTYDTDEEQTAFSDACEEAFFAYFAPDQEDSR